VLNPAFNTEDEGFLYVKISTRLTGAVLSKLGGLS